MMSDLGRGSVLGQDDSRLCCYVQLSLQIVTSREVFDHLISTASTCYNFPSQLYMQRQALYESKSSCKGPIAAENEIE